ncbi:MAG TPA: hypothetical protein VNN18_05845 [Candidatus Xenobia bacterium]|nr:hypothetical protein [Candidatus Xenobia bacterium]
MLILILLLAFATAAHAQMPGPNPAELEAMKKLDYMVGHWQGDSWILGPGGQRMTSRGSETVQWKLGGKVLLVEGLFKSPAPDGTEFTSHETLAVISFDARKSAYNFRTYTARGGAGDHELKLVGQRGWQWTMSGSGGSTIRFTSQFTDDGKWVEIGERSSDGETWQKFFEMTLTRVE